MTNALSVDVEDYFQVSAFEPHFPPASWPHQPSRVAANVDALLATFAAHNARATFFTLGWIGERHPELIRRIVAAGHELASHGYGHRRVHELDRAAFHEDVSRAKGVLEDVAGVAVRGYRAPSFSIDATTPWAREILLATGHDYSSSVYPIRHDHYGAPDAPRHPYHPVDGSGFLELPIATLRLRGRNRPAGGGGYFRLCPYAVSRWAIRRINADDGMRAIFYCHPWEIDPEQPRPRGLSARTRFRHYLNLHRMRPRLERLLTDFGWDRLDRLYLPGDTP